MRALIADDQQIKNGHTYGDAVGDLLEHTRLRAVGNLRRNFDAAIHGPGVEHERVGLSTLEALGVELVAMDVVIGGNGRFVLTLGLHAQHDDDVGVLKRLFDLVNAANGSAGGDVFQLSGNPHSRATEREAAAEFSEQVDIGTSDAGVGEIAENGDVEVFDGALAIANSECVEQALRRMFVGAVARIDHGNVEMTRDVIGGARSGVAHDQAVGLHGVQVEGSVEQGLAFFKAGSFGLQVHGVGAEARSGGGEADAGTGGIFKKRQRHGFTAQCGEFFQRVALDFLKGLALVEKKNQFGRGERLQSQKITKAIAHNFPTIEIPGSRND